jgi:hypothetical protein
MFDRMEIRLLRPGPRFPAQLRFWVNDEDQVERAVGPGGVRWSGWEVPNQRDRPLEFDFDADEYDAEVARAEKDRG